MINAPIQLSIAVIIVVLIILFISYQLNTYQIESFTNKQTKLESDVIVPTRINLHDIYDLFYSQIYNKIISQYRKSIVQIEIQDMMNKTNMNINHSYLLDAGCGDGTYTNIFYQKGFNIIGLDQSNYMLTIAHKNRPVISTTNQITYIEGDFHNKQLFSLKRFSHIYFTYFSFYFSNNPIQLLQNLHYWIQDNGYLILHLVEPTQFDPILDASNEAILSYRPYRKESEKNKSRIYFNNFFYESDYQYNISTKQAEFHEHFYSLSKSNQILRKQTQLLTMYSLQETINLITHKYFTFFAITDLKYHGLIYQYLVYFKKKSIT